MEAVSCNLCGSGSERARVFEIYEVKGQRFPLIECLDCGLAYVSPRPTAAEIPTWYDDRYRRQVHIGYRESFRKKALSFAWPLYRFLIQHPVYRTLTQVVLYPVHKRIDGVLCSRDLDGVPLTGRLLDVGCGSGRWLAEVRKLGFEVEGVEPDPDTAQMALALGLNIFCGDLLAVNFPSSYFDMVRFWHVLEHCHDPMSMLREARRILRGGGGSCWLFPTMAA